MGFFRNGTITHGTSFKSLYNFLGAFNFINTNSLRLIKLKLKKGTQSMRMTNIINQSRIFLKLTVIPFLTSFLKTFNKLRRNKMVFAVFSNFKFMLPPGIQFYKTVINAKLIFQSNIVGTVMMIFQILLNFFKPNAFNSGNSVSKIFINNTFRNTHRFKNLCRLIRLQRRNSHFSRNFNNAVHNGNVVIVNGSVIILVQKFFINKFANTLVGKIRINSPCPVT